MVQFSMAVKYITNKYDSIRLPYSEELLEWLIETYPFSKYRLVEYPIKQRMLKNVLIILLSVIVILFWLKDESDEEFDPAGVIIEYNCQSLDEYDTVPREVLEECIARGLIKNKS